MERSAGRSLWGWTVAGRRLAAGLALVACASLGWATRPGAGQSPDPPVLLVDPNVAPPGVLTALPRLGPVLVGRIVAERDAAPFESLADLDARVRGIGPATVAAIAPHARFGEPPGPEAVAARASEGRPGP